MQNTECTKTRTLKNYSGPTKGVPFLSLEGLLQINCFSVLGDVSLVQDD